MRNDLLAWPGSAAYQAATTPRNSSVTQQPAVVARPQSAGEAAEAVRWAADRNLGVAVQATGHGAGAPIGPHRVLVDTAALDTVSIDAGARLARVGAGTTWSALNSRAQRDGLFGLAGSSPTVSVAGYTFGGGVGWLTHPYGMASSALVAVDYIDGDGRLRRATEDAPNPVDRAALWAFRGGGGVGIATSLTLDLVAPQAVWAGYQLWDITALRPVAEAWAQAMSDIGDALSTHISVVHTPPDWPFPTRLRGVPIVHLAFASPAGPDAAAPLLRALRGAPPPVLDSAWAPADAARLAQIHLDPPNPTPVLGTGRWLSATTPKLAADVLDTAAAPDSPTTMIELRNVGTPAPARDGALTKAPGPFVLHAVGRVTDPDSRAATENGLTRVREAAESADIGQAAASFAQGRAKVADALPPVAGQRLVRLQTAIDPERRLTPSRILAALTGA
ncbi:FAD-binding oxidoreductase [Mycobacterium cookii]|uniref:FAD-linked oxidase n=1 Tax=Mycobacterium cookii TaxID=1775 RepID=A0A7I7L2E4_9MYCO|nr:FAD-binding oxidoreductase [Mycobacterium cookii]MCV7329615.1 FAD-binding oxidoreductase [Mycobacterium cookii]BBX48545.1 FAD-linked oxidase [Mycobacterium cookii]